MDQLWTRCQIIHPQNSYFGNRYWWRVVVQASTLVRYSKLTQRPSDIEYRLLSRKLHPVLNKLRTEWYLCIFKLILFLTFEQFKSVRKRWKSFSVHTYLSMVQIFRLTCSSYISWMVLDYVTILVFAWQVEVWFGFTALFYVDCILIWRFFAVDFAACWTMMKSNCRQWFLWCKGSYPDWY